jgi:hypothetical protein
MAALLLVEEGFDLNQQVISPLFLPFLLTGVPFSCNRSRSSCLRDLDRSLSRSAYLSRPFPSLEAGDDLGSSSNFAFFPCADTGFLSIISITKSPCNRGKANPIVHGEGTTPLFCALFWIAESHSIVET